MMPSTFVRNADAGATIKELDLDGGGPISN